MVLRKGNKWVLYSKDGKRHLGTFDSKEELEERETQIRRIAKAKEAEKKKK